MAGVDDEWVLEGVEGAPSVYFMPASTGCHLGIKYVFLPIHMTYAGLVCLAS